MSVDLDLTSLSPRPRNIRRCRRGHACHRRPHDTGHIGHNSLYLHVVLVALCQIIVSYHVLSRSCLFFSTYIPEHVPKTKAGRPWPIT
jgi:hypothetical protein